MRAAGFSLRMSRAVDIFSIRASSSRVAAFIPCSAEAPSVEVGAKISPSTGMAGTKDANARIAVIGIIMMSN